MNIEDEATSHDNMTRHSMTCRADKKVLKVERHTNTSIKQKCFFSVRQSMAEGRQKYGINRITNQKTRRYALDANSGA
jgi:hypothetical protein